MRAVIQRVKGAAVSAGGREVARIGRGLLVFLGVADGDGPEDVKFMARKISEIRIFDDSQGKMNLPLSEVGGEILAVSQFTLMADCRRGRRPSFSSAAPPEKGERMYREFIGEVSRCSGATVRAGIFGADMLVSIENDGPVTFILDSKG